MGQDSAKENLRGRVAALLRERRQARTERARRASDHQRARERRGEVGRGGVGENGGWSGGA